MTEFKLLRFNSKDEKEYKRFIQGDECFLFMCKHRCSSTREAFLLWKELKLTRPEGDSV